MKRRHYQKSLWEYYAITREVFVHLFNPYFRQKKPHFAVHYFGLLMSILHELEFGPLRDVHLRRVVKEKRPEYAKRHDKVIFQIDHTRPHV